jgi:hypothetical protein
VTFLELQTAVLERFEEDQRDNSKRWINLRYGQLWTAERWTFRQTEANPVTAVGVANLGTVPVNLGRVLGLWDENGVELNYYRPDQWNRNFLADVATSTGAPWGYTVVNGAIKVGPTPSAVATFTLLHLRRITSLVADGDVPELPAEYHWLLVPGAQAQGQIVKQDPNAGMSEQAYLQGIDLLRRDYLEDADVSEQWGAEAWGYGF